MGTFGFLGSTGAGSDALTIAPKTPKTTTASPDRPRYLVVGRMNLSPSVNAIAVPLARPPTLQISPGVVRQKILF